MKLYEVEIDEKNPIKQTVNVIEGDKFILSWISKIPSKKYTVVDEAGNTYVVNNAKLDGKTQTLEVRNSKNVKVLDVQVVAKKSSVRDVDGITENDITRVVQETTGLYEIGIVKNKNQSFILQGSSELAFNQGQVLIDNGVEVDRFKGVIVNEGGEDKFSPSVEMPIYMTFGSPVYGKQLTTYVFTGGTTFQPSDKKEFNISMIQSVEGEFIETKKKVSFYLNTEVPTVGRAFVMMIDWPSFINDRSKLKIVFPSENWAVVEATVEDIAQ